MAQAADANAGSESTDAAAAASVSVSTTTSTAADRPGGAAAADPIGATTFTNPMVETPPSAAAPTPVAPRPISTASAQPANTPAPVPGAGVSAATPTARAPVATPEAGPGSLAKRSIDVRGPRVNSGRRYLGSDYFKNRADYSKKGKKKATVPVEEEEAAVPDEDATVVVVGDEDEPEGYELGLDEYHRRLFNTLHDRIKGHVFKHGKKRVGYSITTESSSGKKSKTKGHVTIGDQKVSLYKILRDGKDPMPYPPRFGHAEKRGDKAEEAKAEKKVEKNVEEKAVQVKKTAPKKKKPAAAEEEEEESAIAEIQRARIRKLYGEWRDRLHDDVIVDMDKALRWTEKDEEALQAES